MNYLKLIQVSLWIAGGIVLFLAGITVNLTPVLLATVIFIGLSLAVVGIAMQQNLLINFAFWVFLLLVAGLVFAGLNHFLAFALVLVVLICWDFSGYLDLISADKKVGGTKFLVNHIFRLAIVVLISYFLTAQALRFEIKLSFFIYILLMLAVGIGMYILTRLLGRETSTNSE